MDGIQETPPTARMSTPPAPRDLAPNGNSSRPKEDAPEILGDSPPSQLPPQQVPTQRLSGNDEADTASSRSDGITRLAKLLGEMLQNFRSLDFHTRLQTLYSSTVVSTNSNRITINLASLQRMQLMVLRRELEARFRVQIHEVSIQ